MYVFPPGKFPRRRATVLVMVVGVLAMLFIVGSTLLVVSRFESQTMTQKTIATARAKATDSTLDSILKQIRLAAVGLDSIPYNGGWNAPNATNTGDTFLGEKYATFPGFDPTSTTGSMAAWTPLDSDAGRLRGGNLLLASSEPYVMNGGPQFFALSWNRLYVPPLAVSTEIPPHLGLVVPANPANLGTPDQDADGDGMPDSGRASSGATVNLPTIDGDLRTSLRIISNGSKVLLDWLTHPALLAQVIHPKDLPTSIQTGADLQNYVFNNILFQPGDDETRLIRRWLLPENLDAAALLNLLPSKDMRAVLPYTLGYKSVGSSPTGADYSGTNLTPHWQQVSSARPGIPTDLTWWNDHVGFYAPALTDAGAAPYDPNKDVYNRQHLITTVSSDDILRPQRDENRLKDFTDATTFSNPNPPPPTSWSFTAFDLISPMTSDPEPRHFQLAYGAMPPPGGIGVNTWALQFNTPAARTQLSLRDVLSDWAVNPASPGNRLLDANGNPISAGFVSYRRVMQLTAMYLAMVQHTNVPGSGKPSVSSDFTVNPGIAPTAGDLLLQLQAAAQLAVNTLDFADAGTPTYAIGGTPTDDPPTRFRWPQPPTAAIVDVVGVERHPYITEAYAKIVQRPPAPGNIPGNANAVNGWNPTPDDPADGLVESIYAVELYNPYDVPLDLSHYQIATQLGNGTAVPIPGANLTNAWIQPYSYLVIANQSIDRNYYDASGTEIATPSGSGVKTKPVFASNVKTIAGARPAVVGQMGTLSVFGADLIVPATPIGFVIPTGASIVLQRKDDVEVTPTGLVFNPADNIVVDMLGPIGDDNQQASDATHLGWVAAKPSTWARPRLVSPEDGASGGTCPAKSADTIEGPVVGTLADIRAPGKDLTNAPLPSGVNASNDRLIRDYSLQRYKETAGVPPTHWHATLARQVLMPEWTRYDYSAGCDMATLQRNGAPDDQTCPAHHHLLGLSPSQPWPGWVDAQIVAAADMQGIQYPSTGTQVLAFKSEPIAGVPVLLAKALPETPHPYYQPYGPASWTVNFQNAVSAVRVYFDPRFLTLPAQATLTITTFTSLGIGSSTNVTQAMLASGAVDLPLSAVPPIIGIKVDYQDTAPAGTAAGFRIAHVDRIVNPPTSTITVPVVPLAFPTTGSLLLVSRYATDMSISLAPSVAATRVPPGVNARPIEVIPLGTTRANPGQIQRLDNGHMPMWDYPTRTDPGQTCSDNTDTSGPGQVLAWGPPQGALNLPWGQLIFNYFTALPIEELYQYRDMTWMGPTVTGTLTNPTSTRLIDLAPQSYNVAWRNLYSGLPVVEPVPGPNGPIVGPKVRGRININTAPWWVLDGLPMLSWAQLPSQEMYPVLSNAKGNAFYDTLDGADSTNSYTYQQLPALLFTSGASDEDTLALTPLDLGFAWNNLVKPPFDLPSISPALARAMVAYREMRTTSPQILTQPTAEPGFLSVGQLTDVLARMIVSATAIDGSGALTRPIMPYIRASGGFPPRIDRPGIWDYYSTSTGSRPYAYLNYMHLVAPLVRLQDWATVKDHVFTIYMTQVDTNGDPNDLTLRVPTHTELTVDATRCLTTNDLPAIINQTAPISYYNVVNDQK